MKKLFMLLALALLLLAPLNAYAAKAPEAPVYLDGERVATALEQGGSTYLPLRTMFELVGAQVDWQEEEQRITAVFANRNVLTLQVASPEAVMVQAAGGEMSYGLEQTPFVRQGVTYVPLRFVTDTVLGYELDWRDNAVWLEIPKLTYVTNPGEVFTLNLLDGTLSRDGQPLAQLYLPSIENPYSWYRPFAMRVNPMGGGLYIVHAQGIGSGALSFGYNLEAYVNTANEAAYTFINHTIMAVELPISFHQGDNWWFSDDGKGAVCINTKTDERTVYTAADIYGDPYAKCFCWWADDRFILLGDGANFDLYDRQNKTLLNMIEQLVTPEIKAEADEFLRANADVQVTDEDLALYWQYLGSGMHVASPTPHFRFISGGEKELYFSLSCRCWQGEDYANWDWQLVYQLPE